MAKPAVCFARRLNSQGERESGRAGVLEQYRASLRSKRQFQSELAKQAASSTPKNLCRVQRSESSQIRVRSRDLVRNAG